MMRSRELAVLASAVVLLFACGGATEPACQSAVTVAVTSSTSPTSTSPTFTWAPNCSVGGLQVYEGRIDGEYPVWIIEARTAGEGAGSPVVYGHAPFMMQESTGPTALVVGHSYRVTLVGATGAEIGTRVFGYP